jgi:hypothetical protein
MTDLSDTHFYFQARGISDIPSCGASGTGFWCYEVVLSPVFSFTAVDQ